MENIYCNECHRKLNPLKKQTNYLGNRNININNWSNRQLHKRCWLLQAKRREFVEYMQHRGFLDKNKVYEI